MADWEGKYLDIRDEHEQLKRQSNEQQHVIKQLYTKLKMIDSAMTKRNEGGEATMGSARRGLSEKESDSLIESLKKENQHLKKVNLSLREKLRAAESGRPTTRSSTSPARRTPSSSTRLSGSKPLASSSGPSTVLKKRLAETEERLKALHEQNNQLRRNLEQRNLEMENRDSQNYLVPAGDRDSISMQRDLKDRDAQLSLMKTRYEQLEAKARAAAEIHERTVFMMEEGNKTIRDLRRRVQAVQHENESLQIYRQQNAELEVELAAAKESSAKLENRLTELCESPFINDAYESKSRLDKLVELERTDRQRRVQIEHLKDTAKTHHAEILALKSSSEQVCKQRDELQIENKELKAKVEHLSRGAGLLEEKMKLYTNESDIDSSALEKALTLVKRGQEHPSALGFLDNSEYASQPEATVLKVNLQQLQVAHLNTCRELEMSERMLKAQTSINKDLNSEVEDLHKKLHGSNNELHRKLEDYESLCAKRLQKIHTLEGQIRQLQKMKHKPKTHGNDTASIKDDDSLSVVSLAASDADFGPGENLIEIWVVGAKFVETKVESNVTSFIMVDFYDYETQTSPLVTGLNPAFDFAATYKIQVDHFLLRYLSSENLNLEVNKMLYGDYSLMGVSSISLRPLLEGNGKLKITELQIISSRDGSVIGHLEVIIRLAFPVADIFDVYLQETPGEKERIEKLKQVEQTTTEIAVARARAQNQIEISITSCHDLGGKNAPSAFAHFQLLGFPDTFTSIAKRSRSPMFDEHFPFPILVDRKLLRFLQREKLEVNILDDDAEGGKDETLVGKVLVPLRQLASGMVVEGNFDLKDNDGNPAGSVALRIGWRNPMVALEDVTVVPGKDSLELTEGQLMSIVKQFDQRGEDTLEWKSFLALYGAGEDAEHARALQRRLRAVVEREVELGLNIRARFAHADKDGSGMFSHAAFRNMLQELRINLSGSDVAALISFLDRSGTGNVSYDTFLAIALPVHEAAETAERKITVAMSELTRKGTDVSKPFRKREVKGHVSTRDFCRSLKDLGFRVEIPDAEVPLARSKVPESELRQGMQFSPAPSDSEEEENDIEDVFSRKKKEFGERMQRMAIATASSNMYSEDDRKYILRQYGAQAEDSASRLQANFRGYLVRKGRAPAESSMYSLVLEAEDAIRAALSTASVKYNLHSFFRKRDANRKGSLKPAIFARALTEAKLDVNSAQANAVAKYFTLGETDEDISEHVDYNEFVRFAMFNMGDLAGLSYQVCIALLQVINEQPFRIYDTENTGQISRKDFLKSLKTIGNLRSLSPPDLNSIAEIFDLDSRDEVYYRDFVGYAKSQPVAIALSNTQEKLYTAVQRATSRGVDVQKLFKRFDRDGDGNVSIPEFKYVLRELNLDLKVKEMNALIARFDLWGRGHIPYSELLSFVTMPAADNSAARQPNMLRLQKRLQNMVRMSMTSNSHIEAAFAHYDWKRQGTLTSEMFQRAWNIAGLPISLPESELILQQFLTQDGVVKYSRFLEWVTPQTVQAKDVVEKLRIMSTTGGHKDFVGTFERFDNGKTGEISRKNFIAGLREMGIELSHEETVSLMGMFDKNADGSIQYSEFARVLSSNGAKASSSGADTYNDGPQTQTKKGVSVEKMRAKLETMDRDLSGKIPIAQFEQAMDELGVEIEPREMDRYLDSSKENVVIRKFFEGQVGNKEYVDKIATRLVKMIQNRADQAGGDLMVPFNHFKADDGGFIDYSSFRNGLDSLEFDLTSSEITAVLEKFDASGDGKISFQEFVRFVSEGTKSSNRSNQKQPGNALGEADAMEIKRLYYKVVRHGFPLRAIITSMDYRQQGFISVSDFVVAIQKLLSDEPSDRISSVAESMDFERDNRVHYEYFLHAGDVNFPRNTEVIEVETRLRKLILEQEQIQKSLRIPFSHFDRKRKGKFDRAAWARAVKDLAVDASSETLEMIFERMNLSRSGRVSFNEFAVFVKDPEYVSQLERKIRKLIMARVLSDTWSDHTVDKAFQRVNENGDQTLDRHQVKKFAKVVELDLSREDIERVMRRFDDNESGTISAPEFIDFIDHCAKWGRQALNLTKRLNLQPRDIQNLQQLIRQVVPVRDFVLAMMQIKGPANISETDAERVAECFDFDMSNRVDVDEFMGYVGNGPSGPVDGHGEGSSSEEDNEFEGLIDKIRSVLQQMRESEKDYRLIFEHFDPTYSGQMSDGDFNQALSSLGTPISSSTYKSLFSKFAGSKPKSIRYRKFLQMLVPAERVYAERVAENVRNLLQGRARHHPRDGMSKALKHFEVDTRGSISRRKFVDGMLSLNFNLSDSDLRLLLDKFDPDETGRVNFREFQEFVEVPSTGSMVRRPLEDASAEADDIFAELRALIRKAHQKGVDYKKSFDHFDRHSSGTIGRTDFKKGLENLGFRVTPEQLKYIQDRFGTRGDTIRYEDFLRTLAPFEDIPIEATLEKFRTLLSQIGDLGRAFKYFERNSRGHIPKKSLVDGLKTLKLKVDDNTAQAILERIDEDHDGEIGFEEFVNFVSNEPSNKTRSMRKSMRGSRSEFDFDDDDDARDAGSTNARDAVTVAIKKIKLGKMKSPFERLYCQFRAPGHDYVRSSVVPLSEGAKKQTVDIDFRKGLVYGARTKERKKLSQALDSHKCRVDIEIVGVKSSGRTSTIGSIEVNLEDIEETMKDLVDVEYSVRDEDDRTIARMKVDVVALDLLQSL